MSFWQKFTASQQPQQQQQVQQQPAPQQQQQQQQTQTQPAALQPNNPAAPNQAAQLGATQPDTNDPTKAAATILDGYAKMFEKKEPDPNAPQEQNFAVAFDSNGVKEQLGKMDFAKMVNPADMAAITAGGEGAAAALGNVMNTMMRQMMFMSSKFSAESANRAAEFAQSRLNGTIPDMVRNQFVNAELSTIPNANHPALQPLVQGLTMSFQQQFPKATPQEIATHVRTYMQTMGQTFAPQQQNNSAQGQQGKPQAEDWGGWFGDGQ